MGKYQFVREILRCGIDGATDPGAATCTGEETAEQEQAKVELAKLLAIIKARIEHATNSGVSCQQKYARKRKQRAWPTGIDQLTPNGCAEVNTTCQSREKVSRFNLVW